MPIQYEEAVTRFFFVAKFYVQIQTKMSREINYITHDARNPVVVVTSLQTLSSVFPIISFSSSSFSFLQTILQHFSLLDLCVTDNNRVHKSYLLHSSVSKQQPNHFSKIIKIENHMCIGMFCYYWLCLRDFFRKQKSKYSSPTHTLRGFEHVLRKVWKCGKI